MRVTSLRNLAVTLVTAAVVVACKNAPRTYDTTVEVVQIPRFGQAGSAGLMDLELKYAECPGDARRVIRAGKAFSQCLGAVKAGEKLPVKVTHAWNADRGAYRSEIVQLGACPMKADPKEEANYEMVQVCSDLQATGVTVGVHCDRRRPPQLVAKCPWLRRN
jgi:hypothetical protein